MSVEINITSNYKKEILKNKVLQKFNFTLREAKLFTNIKNFLVVSNTLYHS